MSYEAIDVGYQIHTGAAPYLNTQELTGTVNRDGHVNYTKIPLQSIYNPR